MYQLFVHCKIFKLILLSYVSDSVPSGGEAGGLAPPSAGYDTGLGHPRCRGSYAARHLKGQARQSRGNCSSYGEVWWQQATGATERAWGRVDANSRYGSKLNSAPAMEHNTTRNTRGRGQKSTATSDEEDGYEDDNSKKRC